MCFTRSVHSVISFGGQPCSVDDAIIKLIQAREGDDGFVELSEKLHPGDKVIIQAGPFKDFVGVLDQNCTGTERVSILLATVTYQNHVVINRALAMKIM